MSLTRRQVQYLKGLAHKLSPAVRTGKDGVTPALVREVERHLKGHELIKVRLDCAERAVFLASAERLAADTAATLVQTIGRIAVLYRASAEPAIKLPQAARVSGRHAGA